MNSVIVGALGPGADHAAGLLTAVGRGSTTSDQTAVDMGVPLRCLLAADRLRAAGAIPADIAYLPYEPDVIAAVIRTALDLLARLPAEVFARDLIVDAAADARAALAALA